MLNTSTVKSLQASRYEGNGSMNVTAQIISYRAQPTYSYSTNSKNKKQYITTTDIETTKQQNKNKIYSEIHLSHSASSVTVNIAYHQRSGFSPSFPFKAVLSPYYDIRYLVCPITIVTPQKTSVRLEKSLTFLILVSAR